MERKCIMVCRCREQFFSTIGKLGSAIHNGGNYAHAQDSDAYIFS